MKVTCLGGGPGGLFLAILLKRISPTAQITVLERNQPGTTFGFGVVFSDATLGNIAAADPETYSQIAASFAHWDDLEIHKDGSIIRSTGHGFCGLSRQRLLEILQSRAQELGVTLAFGQEVLDVAALARDCDVLVAADGVQSVVRNTFAQEFGSKISLRPNRFVWLGTTFPFAAFTFYFKSCPAGMWRIHAYRYKEDESTFIAECTEETFERAGLAVDDEARTVKYLEEVFRQELAGHKLVSNRSLWRNFPNISNERWSTGNIVLLGDAVHTAHFSIGSGTKLAMEDSIVLAQTLKENPSVAEALKQYEAIRKPKVEALQRAAQISLEWFESTEVRAELAPQEFAFSLLTRSHRVTFEELAKRDADLTSNVALRFWQSAAGTAPQGQPWQCPLTVGGHPFASRILIPAMLDMLEFATSLEDVSALGEAPTLAPSNSRKMPAVRVSAHTEWAQVDQAIAYLQRRFAGRPVWVFSEAQFSADPIVNAANTRAALDLSERAKLQRQCVSVANVGTMPMDLVSTLLLAQRADFVMSA